MPESRGTPLVPWKHRELQGTESQAPEPVVACLRVCLEGFASRPIIDTVEGFVVPQPEQSSTGHGRPGAG